MVRVFRVDGFYMVYVESMGVGTGDEGGRHLLWLRLPGLRCILGLGSGLRTEGEAGTTNA